MQGPAAVAGIDAGHSRADVRQRGEIKKHPPCNCILVLSVKCSLELLADMLESDAAATLEVLTTSGATISVSYGLWHHVAMATIMPSL